MSASSGDSHDLESPGTSSVTDDEDYAEDGGPELVLNFLSSIVPGLS